MTPQTESASAREQSEIAAREAETAALAEAQETAPDIPDESSLEKFTDDRVGALDESAADILRSGKLGLEMRSASLGLGQEELKAARQETGVDQALDGIQADVTRLQEQAKTEMTEAAGGEKRADLPVQPEAGFFDSLNQLKEQASQEQDPNKALDARAKTAEFIRKGIPELTDDNAEAFIKEFNEKNQGALRGMELTFVRGRGDKLMLIDESGNLKEMSVTKENAKQALAEIKGLDEKLERKGNSYDLRGEILRRSEGKLKTAEAYTYGGDVDRKRLKEFLSDPENWLPERRRLQEEIVKNELDKAIKLAERMGEKNAVFALRGNTAAGKTTALRTNELFGRAIDPETRQPDGAINPDTYKQQLKTADASPDGWQSVSHYQAHDEGSMISRKIAQRIESSEEASMIIDKRLNEAKDIKELVAMTEKGKSLKFLDVDAPLETSLIRVLGRKAGGADPLVPFDGVAEGFDGVRKNRVELIREAINNDKIDTYVLYAPGPDGKPMLVAEKVPLLGKDGRQLAKPDGTLRYKLKINDRDRFREAINLRTADAAVKELRGQVIDDAYIERTLQKLPEDQREYTKGILEKWKGKSYEEALDAHAKEINQIPPSLDYYQQAALRNLEATSRTAKGTVDTSASKDKAAKMAEGLTAEKAADLAKKNFAEAVAKLFENKGTNFESPAALKSFIEDIAKTINGGILKEGQLLRSGADSDKYKSYTKTADVPRAFEQFAQELFQRMNDPQEDPKKLAAWAEYRIDLTDHFLADGCGKTAKAISSFILMRAEQRLPNYTTREEYYSNAPKEPRNLDGRADDDEQLKKFTEYYTKLVPDKTG